QLGLLPPALRLGRLEVRLEEVLSVSLLTQTGLEPRLQTVVPVPARDEPGLEALSRLFEDGLRSVVPVVAEAEPELLHGGRLRLMRCHFGLSPCWSPDRPGLTVALEARANRDSKRSVKRCDGYGFPARQRNRCILLTIIRRGLPPFRNAAPTAGADRPPAPRRRCTPCR